MKIDTKKYAVVLYDIAKESKGSELKKNVADFIDFLIKKNLIGYLDKILNDFKKYYNNRQKIVEVEITSANELSISQQRKIIQTIEKITGKKVEIVEKVDKKLVGGARISFNDQLIDFSLQASLENLKKNIIANY